MPSNFDAKDERMYQHILANTGDKGIAAATVNKYRRNKGRTKSQHRRRKRA